MSGLPLVQRLQPALTVTEALDRLRGLSNLLLFDSALEQSRVGRYSYLMAEPLLTFELQQSAYGSDPFHLVREVAERCRCDSLPGLPPFAGGFAGLLSYELNGCWERLDPPPTHEFGMPAMVIGLYDRVIAWDHQEGEAWLISHGLDARTGLRDADRAARQAQFFSDRLQASAARVARPDPQPQLQTPLRLERSHPIDGLPGIVSNFSRADYLRAVEQVIEFIHAGDIFQANLSQRLVSPVKRSPLDTYLRLRQQNPAPFAGFLQHDDWAVMSASPELFLFLDASGRIETRPIKGTRRRKRSPEADLYTRDELRESEKDQAENVMIVDLLRNDLSRVCRPGSIRVADLCAVETYQTVQHLVSEIRGELDTSHGAWDLLAATFPGGSITGAPKVRAMQIIVELEQAARGAYCGSLFHLGFDGTLGSSILIRTLTQRHGWVQCPVGGGIVAQSNPQDEYEETLHKAAGMVGVL